MGNPLCLQTASAELLAATMIRQGLVNQDTVGAENIPSVQDQDDDTPAGGVKDLVDYLMCPQCRAEHKIGPNGVIVSLATPFNLKRKRVW